MQLSTQVLLAGALLALSTSTSAVPVPVSSGDDVVLTVVRDLSHAPVAGGDGVLSTRGPVRLHNLDAEERRVPVLLPRVGGQRSADAPGPLTSAETLENARKRVEMYDRKLADKTLKPQEIRAIKRHRQQLLEWIKVIERSHAWHASGAGSSSQAGSSSKHA